MAKVIITIEDSSDGSVTIQSDPPAADMIAKMKGSLKGEDGWHSSFDYAMVMLTAALNKSRNIVPLEGSFPNEH